jgi:hypothetical protein
VLRLINRGQQAYHGKWQEYLLLKVESLVRIVNAPEERRHGVGQRDYEGILLEKILLKPKSIDSLILFE